MPAGVIARSVDQKWTLSLDKYPGYGDNADADNWLVGDKLGVCSGVLKTTKEGIAMSQRFTRKRALVALSVVAALALVGAAIAYFTATGSGTGTASVGSSSNITLAGTITGTLYPAGSPASISVLVTNPGSGSQYVNSVHLDSITTDAGHSSCDLSVSGGNAAFTMADISVAATLTKSGTGGDHTTKTGSLQMNDTGTSQDPCQGAPLTLHFTSN
jgi:hypothetical protein